MKLTIERDHLLTALTAVQARTKLSTQIEILKCVLLKGGDGKLIVSACDLDASCETEVPAEVSDASPVAVAAAPLMQLVKRLPAGSHVDLNSGETSLGVVCGRSRYSFPIRSADDFPSMLKVDVGSEIELSGEEVQQLFSRNEMAISTEESRYYLNGVFLHGDSGALSSCATDGHNLIRVKTEQKFNGAAPVIVPRAFLSDFAKLGGKSGATLRWSKSLIEMRAGGTVLISKLVDGTFPNYWRVIPDEVEECLEFDREHLAGAVERILVATNGKPALLSWSRGGVTLAAHHGGLEELECESSMSVDGQFPLNPQSILSMTEIVTGDRIRLHVNGNGPLRVIDPSEMDLLMLSMPAMGGAR